MSQRTAEKSHLGNVPGVGHAADGNVAVIGAGGVAGTGEELQPLGAALVVVMAVARAASGVGALAVDEGSVL